MFTEWLTQLSYAKSPNHNNSPPMKFPPPRCRLLHEPETRAITLFLKAQMIRPFYNEVLLMIKTILTELSNSKPPNHNSPPWSSHRLEVDNFINLTLQQHPFFLNAQLIRLFHTKRSHITGVRHFKLDEQIQSREGKFQPLPINKIIGELIKLTCLKIKAK